MNRDLDQRISDLLQLFGSDPASWERILPAYDENTVYLARATSLASRWPLFFCAYELWGNLDEISLDPTDAKDAVLRKIRALLEIVFNLDPKHIQWGRGANDRWNDYWETIHELAASYRKTNGEIKITHEKISAYTEKRKVKSQAEYKRLLKDWKNW